MKLDVEKTNIGKRSRNIGKALTGILTTVLCLYAVFFSVYAANEKIISSRADAQNVYLYVKGVYNISGGTVQIGNSVCSNVSVDGLAAFATPLRTVLLIDNSQSIKKDNRTDIQEILGGVIAGRMDGEEFRIGTFSDSVTWLCDYTTDYELLCDTLDEIEYLNQDTYFSDCLYEVIEDMASESEPVYSRIIIASDGADDRAIGYTSSEVIAILEKSNIPVYTIGTLGNNSALETMFSFSRASRAEYYLLDGSIGNDDIIASLSEDHGLVCIRITPDAALLDGSQKNIRVILQTDNGEVTLTAAVDMPFATNVSASEVTPEVQEETEAAPESSGAMGELPILGNGADAPLEAEEEETSSGMLAAVIGIIVVAVIIGIVALAAVLKKKKTEQQDIKPQISGNNGRQNNGIPQAGEQNTAIQVLAMDSGGPLESGSGETLMLNRMDGYDSDRTVTLWDQMQPRQDVRIYLVLRDIERANVVFKVPIQDVVRIGRKNGDITVDYDKHVSAKHCEIIKRGSLLYLKDCGSSNGTYYGERPDELKRIYEQQEVAVVSGGIIQIGHSKFTVTIITE